MPANPAEILEEIEREQARAREEETRAREKAEALERKKAEIAQLLDLAAKYNFDLSVSASADAPPPPPETMSDLIRLYRSTAASPYQKLTHASQRHYDVMLRMIEHDFGPKVLAELSGASFEEWYRFWSEGGKVASAHSKIGIARLVFGFGNEFLHDRDCERLFGALAKLKFKAPKARTEQLTIDQVIAIRAKAHELGRPSIAMAQAFQCDVGMLQKDAIGEWVPVEAKAPASDILSGKSKWIRGVRWNEIDENFILRHTSDSWQGDIEFDLRKAPMVLEEFKHRFGFSIDRNSREKLPVSGPIVVSEYDNLPWEAIEFRRWWRQVANACGIPKNVRNADSRSRSKSSAQDATDDEPEERLAL